MIKTKKKIAGQILSLFLSVIIIAMSAICAFAATPIVLTNSNVVTYPTVEGTCYYGQKIGDALKLVGGEVQYNGVKVEGEFQFSNPDYISGSYSTTLRADLKFVPANADEYTGFTESRSRNVFYSVQKADLILVDESKPPIASSLEAGQKLSDSIISDGQVKNKYNAEQADALTATWSWSNPDTVVTESGYYEARISLTSYNDLIQNIYVEVKGLKIAPTIEVNPIVIPYKPNTTGASIDFSSTKVVNSETNEIITGTFSISETWQNTILRVGSYDITAMFTPNDTDTYTTVEFTIPVTVNKAPITFETEDGSGIPTITVDYGRKTNSDMGAMLKQYVPEDVEIQYIDFNDLETKPLEHADKTFEPGSYTLTCRGITQNKNYAATMLTFKLIVNKVKISPKLEGNGNSMIIRDVNGQHNPKGTFDLYINGELVKKDIPYNEYFTWEHKTSGDKNFEAVYKPGDDNRYEIDKITRTDSNVKLDWAVSTGDGSSADYTYGDTVEIEAPAIDPSKPDKPYYGFAGWSDEYKNTGLSEDELKNAKISFVMPDGSVKLEPTYKFSFKLFIEWIWQQIVEFFTFIFNAVSDLFELAAN